MFELAVGNKDDDSVTKFVLTEDARTFAKLKNMPFFETSAKDNKNVDKVFEEIAKMAIKSNKNQAIDHDRISLVESTDRKNESSSCSC